MMELLISDIIKLQKEFSSNLLKEERDSLNKALFELSKLANATRQLDRDERLDLNRLKAKVTEINTNKRQRLVNEIIKEIPNINELSGLG